MNGLPKQEIVKFYSTVRRYKDHDKTLELLKNHYRFKVSGNMTEESFSRWIEDIVVHALKAKKGE